MTDQESITEGDKVMKAVGELREATEALEREADDCETDPEEVGSWITTIGKALIGIFR